MYALHIAVLVSSVSFLIYGISFFVTPHMKAEFKRFGLEQYGVLTAVLEILGAIGLVVGLAIHPILLISSGGLAVLMLLGLVVRIKVKDGIGASLPALFLLLLNSYILLKSLQTAVDSW
jgi:uncharacterized membrane protein YphA (DoxX/SURF4 family)